MNKINAHTHTEKQTDITTELMHLDESDNDNQRTKREWEEIPSSSVSICPLPSHIVCEIGDGETPISCYKLSKMYKW